ncbi:HD-GYP domain-containing protein [Cohnella hongkongensis]|uniref:HD-GYP domain-containing protein n=1 Tax=Cohnella hongkongensis TaxID=178337 RepID=A0ABV9FEB5_9BACL
MAEAVRALGDFPPHLDHKSDISEKMRLLRYKHEETYHHCVRVALLSDQLASSLQLDLETTQLLVRGCFIHDVGKLLIPNEVLDTASSLTDEQWALMKKHPEFGADILKDNKELQPEIVQLVLHHHERWDGRGYPYGLQGEEIPFSARVCAVADAFDSMLSPRPYRRRKTLSEALEELRRNSGTQFDPAIVERFIPLVSETAPLYFTDSERST